MSKLTPDHLMDLNLERDAMVAHFAQARKIFPPYIPATADLVDADGGEHWTGYYITRMACMLLKRDMPPDLYAHLRDRDQDAGGTLGSRQASNAHPLGDAAGQTRGADRGDLSDPEGEGGRSKSAPSPGRGRALRGRGRTGRGAAGGGAAAGGTASLAHGVEESLPPDPADAGLTGTTSPESIQDMCIAVLDAHCVALIAEHMAVQMLNLPVEVAKLVDDALTRLIPGIVTPMVVRAMKDQRDLVGHMAGTPAANEYLLFERSVMEKLFAIRNPQVDGFIAHRTSDAIKTNMTRLVHRQAMLARVFNFEMYDNGVKITDLTVLPTLSCVFRLNPLTVDVSEISGLSGGATLEFGKRAASTVEDEMITNFGVLNAFTDARIVTLWANAADPTSRQVDPQLMLPARLAVWKMVRDENEGASCAALGGVRVANGWNFMKRVWWMCVFDRIPVAQKMDVYENLLLTFIAGQMRSAPPGYYRHDLKLQGNMEHLVQGGTLVARPPPAVAAAAAAAAPEPAYGPGAMQVWGSVGEAVPDATDVWVGAQAAGAGPPLPPAPTAHPGGAAGGRGGAGVPPSMAGSGRGWPRGGGRR